ncbi:hypothetical protein D3C85_1894890 [compost metagenome]
MRHNVADAHHPFDYVIHVGKIPPHIAIVVNVDGAAFEDFFGKNKGRHIWPTPSTIHSEKAQSGGGYIV